MDLFAPIVVYLLGAILALFFLRSFSISGNISIVTMGVGSALLLLSSLKVLITNVPQTAHLAWHVPYGSFNLFLDPLAGFFLAIISILSFVIAIFAKGYLKEDLKGFWVFLQLLIASLVIVTLARNGLLFIIAWEIMSLTSFFLINYQNEKEEVRKGSFIYLITAQLGSLFLLPFIILMMEENGLAWGPITTVSSTIFLLGFIGFGMKSGLFPFHSWMPEVYPVAISPISALLSAILVNMGLYGILRTLSFFESPPALWGWVLLLVGIASGLFGSLSTLSQKELKKTLAFSSIENMGIITMGIGLAILGFHKEMWLLSTFALLGVMFHILNHAVFKGLLFLGAGAIGHATHSTDLNALGGLLKKMPLIGSCFLIATLSLTSLFSLGTFVGIFLIFLAALIGIVKKTLFSVIALTLLALIEGIAAVSFVGTFSALFLGEPRTEHPIKKCGPLITMALLTLTLLCIIFFWISPLLLPIFTSISGSVLNVPKIEMDIQPLLISILFVVGLFYLFWLLFLLSKLFASRGKPSHTTVTWDCGYIKPTSSIQYTFSSFTQPLLSLFQKAFTSVPTLSLKSVFAEKSFFKTKPFDLMIKGFYTPFWRRIDRFASRLSHIQQGRIQIYLLYIFVTLLLLCLWKVR